MDTGTCLIDGIPLGTIKEALHYEPTTGQLTWIKTRSNRAPKGTLAGGYTDQGYRAVSVAGKILRAHRVAWALYYNTTPPPQIDHIDGNRSNNAISNLREASKEENAWNAGLRSTNKTGIKGLSWDAAREQWRASIRGGGKQHQKRFKCRAEATLWLEEKRLELHGEYAKHY